MKNLLLLALSILLTSCASHVTPTAAPMHYLSQNPSYVMGMNYALGIGVKQDKALAVKYFWKAADARDAYAESELGYMYAAGNGVEKNNKIALMWYERAANHGLASAQYTVGLMYLHGVGTAPNKAVAQQWFKRAGKS